MYNYNTMEYTDETLAVFRLCIQLKEHSCKTSSEAEREIYKVFWNLSYSQIHSLVKHWFHNREKIDTIFAAESRATKQNEQNEQSISTNACQSTDTSCTSIL